MPSLYVMDENQAVDLDSTVFVNETQEDFINVL